MNAASALDWLQQTLLGAATIGAPPILAVLIAGIVVAVFQAATQLNDAAIGFAPKLVVVGIALIAAGEWMLAQLREFTVHVFEAIAHVLH